MTALSFFFSLTLSTLSCGHAAHMDNIWRCLSGYLTDFMAKASITILERCTPAMRFFWVLISTKIAVACIFRFAAGTGPSTVFAVEWRPRGTCISRVVHCAHPSIRGCTAKSHMTEFSLVATIEHCATQVMNTFCHSLLTTIEVHLDFECSVSPSVSRGHDLDTEVLRRRCRCRCRRRCRCQS